MSRLPAACLIALLTVASSALADWDPQAMSKESTLEFLTVGPSEGEHWSTVWLVVIDGQVYIRLGSRAAGRMDENTTRPYVKLRVAGQQVDKVKAEAVPDMAGAVGQAMADKYWSDVFVRHFDHPLVMRLTPQP
jgi:hypothetical protein